MMLALPLVAGLALAEPPDATPVAHSFVTPAGQSALDGAFGAQFVPRYAEGDASTQRRADLRAFAEALGQMSDERRASTRASVQVRLAAVTHWKDELLLRVGDPALPPAATASVLHELDLLAMEEITLRAQLHMLGERDIPVEASADGAPGGLAPDAARDARAQDVVVFGSDVEIAPGQVVRDVVALGGGVRVRGRVLGDVVAFGGDVETAEGGVVLGDVTSLGGRVDGAARAAQHDRVLRHRVEARIDAPTPSIGFDLGPIPGMLAFAGVGLFARALFPEAVRRAAHAAAEQTGRSLLVGAVGTVGTLSAAVVFAVTLLGIPLAAGLVATLCAAMVLGAIGIAEALGGRLVGGRVHPLWVLPVGVVVLTLATSLPWVGGVLWWALAAFGVGVAAISRSTAT